MDTRNKNYLRTALILLSGIVISWLIIVSKPEPEPETHQEQPPHNAEVTTVILGSHSITVSSQGNVVPKTEVDITSQVSGQVTAVGEHFAAGGFFKAGEVLLKLDPRDYEIALARAEAQLAEARKALAQEQGQALQAKREWRDLGDQAANDLFLRKPQLEAAQANVRAAEAGVEQAKLDLDRTRISLPFDGRVVSVKANLGQYINSGATLGSVYASDIMEVRLPLTASELKLLNLSAGEKLHEIKPLSVDLFFQAGDDVLHWPGRVVRLEASVDPKSRLFYLVAEVDNRVEEYTESGKPLNKTPILPGTFVDALIVSNPHDNVVVLPRSALYQSEEVLVLDQENRLRLQKVNVLQADSETLIVKGLKNGQQVLVQPPSFMDLGAVYTPVLVEGVVEAS